MRVRITYSVDVSDRFRAAIRQHFGRAGFATRKEVQRWFREYGDSVSDSVLDDYDQRDDGVSSHMAATAGGAPFIGDGR